MPWSRNLAKPIALKDGRLLVTLADARALMLSLPEPVQRKEYWIYVGALMLEAATSRCVISETRAELTLALRAEGLI
jgi:hypothetical protein